MRKSLLYSCLALLCAAPANAEDITIAESSPNLVATSDATINTSQSINLQKGQEKLQLFLTYYNGDATAPGFTALRISSSSLPYVSEQAFGKGKSITTNVTGDLGWGGNQILITAKGPKGATFGWRLTTPKPVITSLSPELVGSGSTLAINGTNLCSDPADIEVQINGKRAQVVSATSSQIVVKVPDTASGGATSVTVSGAGLDAGKLPVTISAVPFLKGLSTTWAWLNTPVTITGENFGTNPANVAVYMGPLRAPVDSVTPTQIVFRVPEGFGAQGAPTWGFNQPLKVLVNGVRSRNTLIMSTGDQIGI